MTRLLSGFIAAVFTVVILMHAHDAHATPPCVALKDSDFALKVELTPLVVHGKILKYGLGSTKWTEIKVVETLHGAVHGSKLRIIGWSSVDKPLFSYTEGSELIFLLEPDGKAYRLKYPEWKSCVPSLMPLREKDIFAVNTKTMSKDAFYDTYLAPHTGRNATLSGVVWRGPIHPVAREDDPALNRAPAAGLTLFFVDISTGEETGRVVTDGNGEFSLKLPPGTYKVDADFPGIEHSSDLPENVTLEPEDKVDIEINVDTGIR